MDAWKKLKFLEELLIFGSIGFGIIIFVLSVPFGHPNSIGLPLTIAWVAFLLISKGQIKNFKCPRCDGKFFGIRAAPYRMSPFKRDKKCAYCDLDLWSDPKKKS